MGERIFTEAELKEMGVETVDLIQQAIDAGDLEKAKKLTRRMHREFFAMHEGFRNWIACLLSFIGRRLGDEALYEALYDAMSHFADYAKAYRKENVLRQVQMLAAGLRGHLNPLVIEEDDEKVTIMMTPCGSGGRAILNGYYDPPKNYLKVKKPQVMTFGRSNFPVYCCHGAFQDIVPIEMDGYPIWVTLPSEKLGEEPCRFIIYKDLDNIPAEYYERFGKKKPTR